MKKILGIFLLVLHLAVISAAAQESLSGRLERLRDRYGIRFVYDAALSAALEQPADTLFLSATLPLEEALERSFSGKGLSWQVRGRSVVLKAAPVRPAAPRIRRVTLSGHITDAASGETLIGAGILSGTLGTVTNEFGFYSLTLPAGVNAVGVSHLGFDRQDFTFDLQRDTTLDVALTANNELTAARIVDRKDAGLQSVYAGSLEVPVEQIRNTPALFGEADEIKAMQLLPGVQGGFEGFSGLHVRGGGPEENLVLLDGVPIYNMDHMLGIFSIFQPEAVKDVTLYKGAFPARYGGRISSIVDIRTNDGNRKETHGSLTVGLLNDKFHLEGPLVKDRLSYSLSARGLHSILADPLLRLFLKDRYYGYYFYDLNGKLSWQAGPRDRLYLGVYHGADRGGFSEQDQVSMGGEGITATDQASERDLSLAWGNTVASLRWNHIFNPRLFANTTLSYNRFRMLADVARESTTTREGVTSSDAFSLSYRSGIRDFGARTDFDWTPSPAHLVKFGAEFLLHRFYPEQISTLSGDGTISQPQEYVLGKRYPGSEASLYLEDNLSLGAHVSLDPGLRVSWFHTQGQDYLSLQPRVSARIALDNGLAFKAGYARMAQYVHLLSSTTVALPLDLWVPITKDIRPVTSDQFSLGLYYDGLPGWQFSLEGYWKEMYNLLEYKQGVIFLANSDEWETQVEMGRGRSRGVEFFVRKTSGKTTGWISYTLAKSDRWFPDGSINMGRPFPYKYDRRHSVNLVVSHRFSEKVDLSASWILATGGTMTLPTRTTAILVPDSDRFERYIRSADNIGSRNNYRLPPTHRLNLGVNLRHTTRRGNEVVWNISVYNAYNAMNPNFVMTGSQLSSLYYSTSDRIQLNKITVLPILPSFSYTLNF